MSYEILRLPLDAIIAADGSPFVTGSRLVVFP